MTKSVYGAPKERDFKNKVVKGVTYLDCLSGHSLNPDVQVNFSLKTLPLRTTAGYILDGDVHESNPRYTSNDPDSNPWHANPLPAYIPLDSGDVEFVPTGFPILPALYKSKYQFENQRSQIESNEREASTLLPYLIPKIETQNAYQLITNVPDPEEPMVSEAGEEQKQQAISGDIGYDPRNVDGRNVLLMVADFNNNYEETFVAMPQIGGHTNAFPAAPIPTLYTVNTGKQWLPLEYNVTEQLYQLSSTQNAYIYLNFPENDPNLVFEHRRFTILDREHTIKSTVQDATGRYYFPGMTSHAHGGIKERFSLILYDFGQFDQDIYGNSYLHATLRNMMLFVEQFLRNGDAGALQDEINPDLIGDTLDGLARDPDDSYTDVTAETYFEFFGIDHQNQEFYPIDTVDQQGNVVATFPNGDFSTKDIREMAVWFSRVALAVSHINTSLEEIYEFKELFNLINIDIVPVIMELCDYMLTISQTEGTFESIAMLNNFITAQWKSTHEVIADRANGWVASSVNLRQKLTTWNTQTQQYNDGVSPFSQTIRINARILELVGPRKAICRNNEHVQVPCLLSGPATQYDASARVYPFGASYKDVPWQPGMFGRLTKKANVGYFRSLTVVPSVGEELLKGPVIVEVNNWLDAFWDTLNAAIAQKTYIDPNLQPDVNIHTNIEIPIPTSVNLTNETADLEALLIEAHTDFFDGHYNIPIVGAFFDRIAATILYLQDNPFGATQGEIQNGALLNLQDVFNFLNQHFINLDFSIVQLKYEHLDAGSIFKQMIDPIAPNFNIGWPTTMLDPRCWADVRYELSQTLEAQLERYCRLGTWGGTGVPDKILNTQFQHVFLENYEFMNVMLRDEIFDVVGNVATVKPNLSAKQLYWLRQDSYSDPQYATDPNNPLRLYNVGISNTALSWEDRKMQLSDGGILIDGVGAFGPSDDIRIESADNTEHDIMSVFDVMFNEFFSLDGFHDRFYPEAQAGILRYLGGFQQQLTMRTSLADPKNVDPNHGQIKPGTYFVNDPLQLYDPFGYYSVAQSPLSQLSSVTVTENLISTISGYTSYQSVMRPFDICSKIEDFTPLNQRLQLLLTKRNDADIFIGSRLGITLSPEFNFDFKLQYKSSSDPEIFYETAETFLPKDKSTYAASMNWPEFLTNRCSIKAGEYRTEFHTHLGLPQYYAIYVDKRVSFGNVAQPRTVKDREIISLKVLLDQKVIQIFDRISALQLRRITRRNCHPECDFTDLYSKQPIIFFSQEDIGEFFGRTFENEHGKKTRIEFRIQTSGGADTEEPCSVSLIYCNRTIDSTINHTEYMRT